MADDTLIRSTLALSMPGREALRERLRAEARGWSDVAAAARANNRLPRDRVRDAQEAYDRALHDYDVVAILAGTDDSEIAAGRPVLRAQNATQGARLHAACAARAAEIAAARIEHRRAVTTERQARHRTRITARLARLARYEAALHALAAQAPDPLARVARAALEG